MSNKYNARKVRAFGYTFASQVEYERYVFLKGAEQRGEIGGLRVHPKYSLLDAFIDNFRQRHRAITYTGDFEYLSADGFKVCEDVKGGKATQTEAFVLRRKLFALTYPNIKHVIVTDVTREVE